jgi:DNA adenine methylase
MNEQTSAWLTAVEGLSGVYARLKRVAILNRNAIDVIRQQDGPGTLFYLDPPYLSETRSCENVYAYEMPADQHLELMEVIEECKGHVMRSGYASAMYNARLKHWTRHEFSLHNQAASGKRKRRMIEVVWCNF